MSYRPYWFYFSFLFTDDAIPVAALSKRWVCGHSLALTAGSNLAGGMGVRLLCVL